MVIGAGPGGYSAAFHAADLGVEVTLVDSKENPGGVCLFQGCIPTKALLHSAKIIRDAAQAPRFGVEFKDLHVDLKKINAHKDEVVEKLTRGLGQLRKMRKIRYIQGRASFIRSDAVTIENPDGSRQELSYDQVILATGSCPVRLPFEPDSPRIMDSECALNVETVPKNILIIGGGYIGLEFASLFSDLGTTVTLVEMLPDLLMAADRDIVSILQKELSPRLAAIHTSTKVTAIKETPNGVSVAFEDKDGKTFSDEFEKVLVAVGRKPLTKNLGLENTQVTLDDHGFVKVNAQRLTTDPRIYAVGDIAGQPMLAHKATMEGVVAAEAVAGKKTAFAPRAIPSVVYTNPEIAWSGLTENEAKKQNLRVKILKFPWSASGRAVTLKRTDGLTKMIVDEQTGKILGLAMIGESASEMLAEGGLAIEMGATARDIARTIHPHPTLSETLKEAADSFAGQSLNLYRPKR